MWIVYLFLVSLIITDATITAALAYIAYQLFQTRQRYISFLVGLAALVCGLNLVVILTSLL